VIVGVVSSEVGGAGWAFFVLPAFDLPFARREALFSSADEIGTGSLNAARQPDVLPGFARALEVCCEHKVRGHVHNIRVARVLVLEVHDGHGLDLLLRRPERMNKSR
jgi:hypothetical protein